MFEPAAPWVLPFEALDAHSLPLAGGKGANLGEMTRAGFPVPAGFCITTAAYDEAVRAVALGPVLAALATTAPGDPAALSALAAEARGLLLAARVPEAIAREVRAAYLALGEAVPVAVRSSATAEDLPTASFAGQQDTYLHVVGPDAVLDAMRRCWASLFTERAVSYRAKQRIDPRRVSLAVVIQRMVDAETAGVAFSANPMTGKRAEVVVDVSYGLGEAVVSGAVNPDHFTLDAAGHVLTRRLGDKRLAIRSVASGGTHRHALPDGSALASLDDAHLAQVAALAGKAERHYLAPQDLEFAFDAADRLWLLQTRAITTLYPLPSPQPTDLRVYFSFNVAQGVLQPFTPMGLQAVRLLTAGGAGALGYPAADPVAGARFVVEAGSRLFFDITPAVRDPLGRKVALLGLGEAEARSAEIVRAFGAEEPALAVLDRPMGRSLLTALRLAARSRLPLRALSVLARPAAGRARALGVTPTLLALGDVAPGANAEARLRALEKLLTGTAPLVLSHVLPAAAAGLISSAALSRLLSGLATPAELQIVRRGLPYNPTTEMNLALARIAADPAVRPALEVPTSEALVAAYRAGKLPEALSSRLQDFLAAYGHRGLPEIDMGTPRWREDPSFLLGALHNLALQTDTEQRPDAQFRRARAESAAMADALARRAAQQGFVRGRLVRFFLDRLQGLMGLREVPKFNLVAAMARGRTLLLPVGEELVRLERLASPTDIFWLSLPEVRGGLAGADLKQSVEQHKEAYELERSRRSVPRILLSDGRVPTGSAGVDSAGALRGTAASPGRVTARVRVVMDPNGAHLEPGEILVAPSTDPGWTPLFLTAGGLVMEMGGAMSHGAVVAREYGIPAVVGVPGATEHLVDGQLVTVDGTNGLILAVDAPGMLEAVSHAE